MFQALATTDAESRLYEFNARNQITLWGPDGDILCYHSILPGIIVGLFISPTFSNYIQTVISSSDKSHSLAPRPDPRLCRQAMVWAGGQVLHSKVAIQVSTLYLEISLKMLCFRWKMFFKTLEQCLVTGSKFDSDAFKVIFKLKKVKSS